MDEWWNDATLTELRRIMVNAIANWDLIKPDPNTLIDDMSQTQRDALGEAMAAQAAYDARRSEIGAL